MKIMCSKLWVVLILLVSQTVNGQIIDRDIAINTVALGVFVSGTHPFIISFRVCPIFR